MSLPIPPISGTVTAAIAAARVAATAVQQVASVVVDQADGATTFGEMLRGEMPRGEKLQGETPSANLPAQSPDQKIPSDDLRSQFVDAARQVMASLGIGPGEAVSLSIDHTGRIELSGDHPPSVQDRAAQIEAVLAADSSLASMAQQLLSASGTNQATIELPTSGNLTIPLSQANIGMRFGG